MAAARNSIRPSRHALDGWSGSGAEFMVTRARQSVKAHVWTVPGCQGTSDVAALVGAAMGSVFQCASYDHWPSRMRETGGVKSIAPAGVALDFSGSTDGIAIGGYNAVPFSPLACEPNLVDIHCGL